MCLTGKPENLKNDDERAKACGFRGRRGETLRAHPAVQDLFVRVARELRDEEIRQMSEPVEKYAAASRAAALDRLWQIANLSKEQAGNTMHAQVHACVKYIEFTSGEGGEHNSKLPLPRARWMDPKDKDKPN